MTFGYQDVVDCNRVITGGGALSSSRRGQQNLTAFFQGGEIQAHIVNVCQAAHSVVTRQYFNDGNHRTGVLMIYTILIRKRLVVSRKKAYQVYAYLDEAFHRSQEGSPSNLDDMTNFIGNGGFMKLAQRPDLVDEYVTRKEAEVMALGDLLPRLAQAPKKPGVGVPFTDETRQQLKEDNAALRAWREKRRIFMAIKGGTASHSSDQ
jgi:uncharacterized protein YjhX (UPF0386 family)